MMGRHLHWVVWIWFAVMILSVMGCATFVPDTLCTVEPEAERCWMDKQAGRGLHLRSIAGYVCMSPEDLRSISARLNDCDHSNIPPAGRVLRSVCTMEPKASMCWYNKIQSHGIALNEMRGFFCLTPQDLRAMVEKLNKCHHYPED